MSSTRLTSDRKVPNDPRETSRDPSTEHVDWVKKNAKPVPAKIGARLTDLTPRGFQEIRAGRNKPSFDALTKWCRNDIATAVSYAIHIGLVLPGDVEMQEELIRRATQWRGK